MIRYKSIHYNGELLDAILPADGWIRVSTQDVRRPSSVDVVEMDGEIYDVVSAGKGMEPYLAPPRTHWTIPIIKVVGKEKIEDKEE